MESKCYPTPGGNAACLGEHMVEYRQGTPRDQFFLTSKVSAWDLDRNETFQKIFDSLPGEEQQRLRRETRDEIERRRLLVLEAASGTGAMSNVRPF